MTATNTYTGPAYWIVVAVDEHAFELRDQFGSRVATYPNFELADRVRQDKERKALRAYLRAQRKATT